MSVGVRDILRLVWVCVPAHVWARMCCCFYFFFRFFLSLRRRLVKKYLCFFPTDLARPSCGKYTRSSVGQAATTTARRSPLSRRASEKYIYIYTREKKRLNIIYLFFVSLYMLFLFFVFYCYIFPIIIFPVSAKSLGNYRPVLPLLFCISNKLMSRGLGYREASINIAHLR